MVVLILGYALSQSAAGCQYRLKTFFKLLSIFWTPLISEDSSCLFSKLHCEVIVCPFDKGFESFIYALQVQFHMQ